MAIVHIAFIECVLEVGTWIALFGYPNDKNKQPWSQYESLQHNAKISLVDIGQTRRYLEFRYKSVVQIANNVLSYLDADANDLAVDESKQFPKKKGISD